MAFPTITPLPTPPSRTSSPSTFSDDADAFLNAFPTLQSEINTSGEYIDTAVSEADADRVAAEAAKTAAETAQALTETARDSALASSNYKGEWSSLAGALATPASVSHQGLIWLLVTSLADVTASEPTSDNGDWQVVDDPAFVDPISIAKVNPTFDLNGSEVSGVPVALSVTNSANGTFTNAQGFIEKGTSNVPRISFDGNNKKLQGIFIEEQRSNLLNYTEDISVTNGYTLFNSLLTPSAGLSPDGMKKGSLIRYSSTSSLAHHIKKTLTLDSSYDYTYSVYVKMSGANYFYLLSQNKDGTEFGVVFDLLNETTSTPLGSPTNITIKNVGNSWYRVSITHDSGTGGTTPSISFGITENSGSITSAGTKAKGALIWGAQVEKGSSLTSYIPSSTGFTSRASSATYIDSQGKLATAVTNQQRLSYSQVSSSLTPKLILEEESTNQCLHSNDFTSGAWGKVGTTITPNATLSPDGTSNGHLVTKNAASDLYVGQSISLTAGVYTLSFWAKKGSLSTVTGHISGAFGTSEEGIYNFNLENEQIVNLGSTAGFYASMERFFNYANGELWYRCSLTCELTTVTAPYVRIYPSTPNDPSGGSVYLYGVQLEEYPIASSYIATTTTSVTRAADVSGSTASTRTHSSLSTSSNSIDEFYNQKEGTFYIEYSIENDIDDATILRLYNDSTTNEISYRFDTTSPTAKDILTFTHNGQSYSVFNTATGLNNQRNTVRRVAFAYKANDIAISYDGNDAITSSSCVVPYVSRIFVGSTSASLNGLVKRIIYFPVRLSNAKLQKMTRLSV